MPNGPAVSENGDDGNVRSPSVIVSLGSRPKLTLMIVGCVLLVELILSAWDSQQSLAQSMLGMGGLVVLLLDCKLLLLLGLRIQKNRGVVRGDGQHFFAILAFMLLAMALVAIGAFPEAATSGNESGSAVPTEQSAT